jgi:hypothetical protein
MWSIRHFGLLWELNRCEIVFQFTEVPARHQCDASHSIPAAGALSSGTFTGVVLTIAVGAALLEVLAYLAHGLTRLCQSARKS